MEWVSPLACLWVLFSGPGSHNLKAWGSSRERFSRTGRTGTRAVPERQAGAEAMSNRPDLMSLVFLSAFFALLEFRFGLQVDFLAWTI